VDNGQVVRETQDARIVACREANQYPTVLCDVKPAQNLREVGSADLAGSSGTADDVREACDAPTLILRHHSLHRLSDRPGKGGLL